jgi:hypothetical protein
MGQGHLDARHRTMRRVLRVVVVKVRTTVSSDHELTVSLPREIPCPEPLGPFTLAPRPLARIGQRRKVAPAPDDQDQNDRSNLDTCSRSDSRGDEIKHRAKAQHRKPEGGEVMVQEELSLHEEEREVMEGPGNHEESANLVVECSLSCL